MNNKTYKCLIAVPARLESKRLPNKVLKDINGKPMLRRVLDKCSDCKVEAKVIVCTDSEEIKKSVNEWGYEIKLTSKNCNSGSQRIASVIDELVLQSWGLKKDNYQEKILEEILDNTLVINVQGDQPFVDPNLLSKIYKIFIKNPQFQVITPVYKLNKEDIHNPNIVKIAASTSNKNNMEAIYFSRSPIPYGAEIYYEHIGIYIYKRDALDRFTSLEPSSLEKEENLEQLRALQNSLKINLILTDDEIISIDTLDDVERLMKASQGGDDI